MFGLCYVLYQIWDSLPRQCHEWNHTKWDLAEFGVSAGFVALMWRIALMAGVLA
jgi:hypothetical protein